LTLELGSAGLVNVVPGWGIEDFVSGCGVICNPSYLIGWSDTISEHYVLAPDSVVIAFKGFDLNTDRAAYKAGLER
jgi:hypothetical protein